MPPFLKLLDWLDYPFEDGCKPEQWTPEKYGPQPAPTLPSSLASAGRIEETWEDEFKTAVAQEQRFHAYRRELASFVYRDLAHLVVTFLQSEGPRVGATFDVYCDNAKRWFIGCILKEENNHPDGDRLYVHYIGWDTKWRAWIPRSPTHIQPLGRETSGYLSSTCAHTHDFDLDDESRYPTSIVSTTTTSAAATAAAAAAATQEEEESKQEPPMGSHGTPDGRWVVVHWFKRNSQREPRGARPTTKAQGRFISHTEKTITLKNGLQTFTIQRSDRTWYSFLPEHRKWTCPNCKTFQEYVFLHCANCWFIPDQEAN